MGISPYLAGLREHVGPAYVLVPSAGAIVRRRGDANILVVRQDGDPRWLLPGGAVDPDEHPRDAIRREIREETGLELDDVRLLGCGGGPEFRTTYPNGDVCGYVISLYEGWVDAGADPQPVDGELDELRWVTDAELRALDTKPWVAVLLGAIDGTSD